VETEKLGNYVFNICTNVFANRFCHLFFCYTFLS